MSNHRQRTEELGSHILAITHRSLEIIILLSMGLVYRFFGLSKERVTLRHAEIFLVMTTVLLIGLIFLGQIYSSFGWALIILGNLRIFQIIALNLSTLLFDHTPIGEPAALIKRARWHFVAIGFSFLDAVLVFGFMYQFFDRHYRILNQHFETFLDYLYYAVVTMTTIGYGDIHPVTHLGKILVMYQASVALLFLLFFVSGALTRLNRHYP